MTSDAVCNCFHRYAQRTKLTQALTTYTEPSKYALSHCSIRYASLKIPFPLLIRFSDTGKAPENLNAAPEDLNAAPEDP